MTKKIAVGEDDVLVVVDIQKDFCPGGSLSVPRGDEVVPLINRLATRFEHVVLTQDWHAPDHLSFASAHPGKQPYDTVMLPYGAQILWPNHCVRATQGAEFHKDLQIPQAGLVLRKGIHRSVDSYSTFYENDRKRPRASSATCASGASAASSSPGSPWISACATRRKMPVASDSGWWLSRMPVGASMSTARWSPPAKASRR